MKFNADIPPKAKKKETEPFSEQILDKNIEKYDENYEYFGQLFPFIKNGGLSKLLSELYKSKDTEKILTIYKNLEGVPLEIADEIKDSYEEESPIEIKDELDLYKKMIDAVGPDEILEQLPANVSLTAKRLKKDISFYASIYFKFLSKEDKEKFECFNINQLNGKEFDKEKFDEKDEALEEINSLRQISKDYWGVTENGVLLICKTEKEESSLLESLEKEKRGKLDTFLKSLANDKKDVSEPIDFNDFSEKRYDILEKMEPRLREISSEDLFFSKNKEVFNPKQETKEFLRVYGAKEIFNKYLNIDSTKDLTLREQYFLFNYLSLNTEKDFERVSKICNKFENKGAFLSTFLSIEQGGQEMGDKILGLGEKLPKETSEKVFAKYGEIIEVANKAEEEIRKLYGKENISKEISLSVQEVLLRRGAKFLSELGDRASSINEQEVLQELENIKTETMILGSSYLELYKSGENIPFDEIDGTTVEKISSQNLKEENKKEIIEAYRKGRPKETYENEEHLRLLTNEFSENLNKKETFVFNIRFKGEIIAFATFQKQNEDTFHIGGLTFLEDVRNPVIAEAVMNSIMKEFGRYNITAEVHSKNKILNMYQKRFGFKIVREMPLEENAGELYYKIERPKDQKIEEKQELAIAA